MTAKLGWPKPRTPSTGWDSTGLLYTLFRPDVWFTMTRFLICGRGECAYVKAWKVRLGGDAINAAEKN